MIPYFTGIDACYSSGVFIKLTRRGPNEYVQLVEAYRDDAGRPKATHRCLTGAS